jgi:hypothetical protein
MAVLFLVVLLAGNPFAAFVWCVAVFAVWVISLYPCPFAPCLRCHGSGRGRIRSRRAFGECGRCKGTGRRIRPGAKTVHRGRVSLAERKRKGKSR